MAAAPGWRDTGHYISFQQTRCFFFYFLKKISAPGELLSNQRKTHYLNLPETLNEEQNVDYRSVGWILFLKASALPGLEAGPKGTRR